MDGLFMRGWLLHQERLPVFSRAWDDWNSPEDALYDEFAAVDDDGLREHAKTSVAVAWADGLVPGWYDETN
ncbi:hypothetical protein ACIBQ1_09960 [Nonomuraea sp. NPDC050153]|uniref:hypothetical protein n=1 Tax=Nonomuraea sp. NPDC050153 TaxID=3364359 RepID=UPI003790999B